jgi:hypothetical protein
MSETVLAEHLQEAMAVAGGMIDATPADGLDVMDTDPAEFGGMADLPEVAGLPAGEGLDFGADVGTDGTQDGFDAPANAEFDVATDAVSEPAGADFGFDGGMAVDPVDNVADFGFDGGMAVPPDAE